MLFLHKFLPVFFLPLGVVMLLLVYALWRRKRWPVAVAILVLYLGSTPLVGDGLIGWMETRYPAVPVAQVGPADAIVVLGGILGPQVAPGYLPNWADPVERFEAGVALMRAGKAGHLVFTGARIEWEPRVTTEGEQLRQLAVARGIPADKILVTGPVDNTATEARAVAVMVRERGWKRIILVTTGWHMPRSAYLFRRAGVDCTLFPVDFRADHRRRIFAVDFLPNAESLMKTETALRECYGWMFYAVTRR